MKPPITLFCPHCSKWLESKLYAEALQKPDTKMLFCVMCGRPVFCCDTDYPKAGSKFWANFEYEIRIKAIAVLLCRTFKEVAEYAKENDLKLEHLNAWLHHILKEIEGRKSNNES